MYTGRLHILAIKRVLSEDLDCRLVSDLDYQVKITNHKLAHSSTPRLRLTSLVHWRTTFAFRLPVAVRNTVAGPCYPGSFPCVNEASPCASA
jgi:hypothetical protein